ncbi:MAG: DUF4065 domain-containing protein [Gammaproteobacteria bacterium AqS3]|nr:DUF4065 domain-containing protein [Gammaproteobacteria bacterium AqS3]
MLLKAGKPLNMQIILKTAYLADRRMLNEHQRPIFGAIYIGRSFGPVPWEIYEMLKGEPYWLSELQLKNYPWKLKGHHVELVGHMSAKRRKKILNPSSLTKDDMTAIKIEFRRCLNMNFSAKTRVTHQMDWVRGAMRPDELMAYEDMIDDKHPHKEEIIEDLLSESFFLIL